MGLFNLFGKKKKAPKSVKPKSKAKKTSGKVIGKKKAPSSSSMGVQKKEKNQLPDKFPFWARLKIDKQRTTLVIDEEDVLNKKTRKKEAGYVHRESTHTKRKGTETIIPNPDRNDPDPMYLKKPKKLPKTLFKPHNKKLDMPESLKARYEKNNRK